MNGTLQKKVCMKKILFMAGAMMITGAASAGLPVKDNFDWGPGVNGRISITDGQSVNGQITPAGGAVWKVDVGTSVFKKTVGSGGTLAVSGSNNRTGFDCAVDGNITASMEYVYQTINTAYTPGVWLGFTADSTKFLSNDTAEKIYVRINPAARKMSAGVTTLTGTNVIDHFNKMAALAVAEGDRLVMTLHVDMAAKSAAARVKNITQGVENSVEFSWTGGSGNWSYLMINETANQTIIIDSISVRSEPGTVVGMLTPDAQIMSLLRRHVCL